MKRLLLTLFFVLSLQAYSQCPPTTPDAGTLTADAISTCNSADTLLTATPNGDSVVPTNYEVAYVLTSGAGLVIEQTAATPSFTVATGGDYTIHTLVA
ncbi:MAG: hypothetical protein HRT68_04745, partial [Flavobacteriaceae bacterium]|nr:hypothetical protein [Flavobacteriaceae bacterium]